MCFECGKTGEKMAGKGIGKVLRDGTVKGKKTERRNQYQ